MILLLGIEEHHRLDLPLLFFFLDFSFVADGRIPQA